MPQDPISRVAVRANMLGGAVHGHAGIRDYFRKFTDTFESIRSRSSESWSAGDLLVGWCKCTGEPRASAVDLDSQAHFAVRIRDGRTWPVAACRSEQEALEAVGLNRQEAREGGPRPPPSAAAASMEERASRSAATRRSLRTMGSSDAAKPAYSCSSRRKQA
jgi:SnoaL-like domain